jgi:hypothetical protein
MCFPTMHLRVQERVKLQTAHGEEARLELPKEQVQRKAIGSATTKLPVTAWAHRSSDQPPYDNG